MAHYGAGWEPVEGLRTRIVQLAEKAVDVERERGHPVAHLTLPHLARAVPVDLDSVLVRIGQVERLADEMIREPDEGDSVADGVRQPAREVDAFGHEQGEVVEPGMAACRLRSGLLDQAQQLTPTGPERRRAAVAIKYIQADGANVVVDRAVEVRDRQVHRADRGGRRQQGARRRARRLELLRITGSHPIAHHKNFTGLPKPVPRRSWRLMWRKPTAQAGVPGAVGRRRSASARPPRRVRPPCAWRRRRRRR